MKITLTGFKDIKKELPEDFDVCVLILKNGVYTAGCWDTGLYATEDGSPGCFRQGCGGVIDFKYVKYWLPIEKIERSFIL